MRSLGTFFIAILTLILGITTQAPARGITDPYEILEKHFQAIGGLDRLLAEQVFYLEGDVSLGGMNGTVKTWTLKPGRNRIEIALGPLNIIQGDNGEHEWILDQNGKLQVITNPDDATAKRRRVRRLIEKYAFIKKESEVFAVNLEGNGSVDGKDCYVVRISNNINYDSYTTYLNTKTFMQEKAVFIEDNLSRDVYYGDYREIDGLLIPFWTKEVLHRGGQTQETKFTRYLSNPEINPGLFEPPEHGDKDYQFTEGDCAEDIPFEFIGNHLFIMVTVGGLERLWVLDTGAGMSVLNMAFAKELGLELEGELKGQGAGGTVHASLTTLPPYSLKGIQFKEQMVAVIDMEELVRRIGLDIVGILGFDFLSRFVTKVDYSNELVSFYEPGKFEYTGHGQVLDIHISHSQFGVQATLDGTHTGNWLFDLGAGTTHLDGRYARREGYADQAGVLGMGHGAGNEYQLKQVECDSMQFAGFTVHEPEISFSYGGTDTTFTADRIGVLGNSLFRNFVLYCDYANERLIVEEGDKFNKPWPRDNSGLQIAWSYDHDVEVTYVSPDTPGEKAGFLKGDLLKSINGIDVDLLDGIIAIRKLLKADPGVVYEFVIERSGKKKLKLMLADLL
jgi:hypothetical protein